MDLKCGWGHLSQLIYGTYLIGVGLAVGILGGCTAMGMDRERSFYAVLLMVVALYYALFAVMSGSSAVLLAEMLPIAGFVLAAAIGFKKNLWLVAVGLVGHGVFDFFHGHVISNPGVPVWWPGFCGAFDVVAGVYMAYRLWGAKIGVEGGRECT